MSRRTAGTAVTLITRLRARLGWGGAPRRVATLAAAVVLALVLGALGGAALYLLLAAL